MVKHKSADMYVGRPNELSSRVFTVGRLMRINKVIRTEVISKSGLYNTFDYFRCETKVGNGAAI